MPGGARPTSRAETIFALSSGRGRAGVAVIRISGPEAGAALVRLTGGRLPAPRVARVAALRDPGDGSLLDRGLVVWFPGPASFTGEDVAELQVHGGPAVVAAIVGALARLPGLRPAEPGEFTRRAFERGRLDLTEAEGLADLVAAETEAQRRQALRQLDGALGELYEGWRRRLIDVVARLEAEIDFPEEGLPAGVGEGTRPVIEQLIAEVSGHLDDGRRGERLRDGLYAVIVGAPNVGKSSLLNRLARREAAIVAAEPGTTRDVIEVHLDVAGYPLIVADTAGLREAAEPVESEGVRRARDRAGRADLRIALFDAREWPARDKATAALVDEDSLVVVNKTDLVGEKHWPDPGEAGVWPVSARTGAGLDALEAGLAGEAEKRLAGAGAPCLTRARHRRALEEVVEHLSRALGAPAPELAAEDARLAGRALGRITGRVDVEDILDVVFAEFCIGK